MNNFTKNKSFFALRYIYGRKCGNNNPVFFLFMIFHRCVTRVTRLVAHVEQELLTVPEYLEVIHVLELGSCVSKTHNTMAKRQNTYNVSFGHFVACRFSIKGF
jgi:hypothetical protein